MKTKLTLEEIARRSIHITLPLQILAFTTSFPQEIDILIDNPKRLLTTTLAFLTSSYLSSQNPKNKLTTNKNYSIIRHPMYTGFRLASLGLIVANPSIENIIAGGLVWGTTEITAREEEKNLIKKNPRYLEYMKKVPRWIPYSNKIKEIF